MSIFCHKKSLVPKYTLFQQYILQVIHITQKKEIIKMKKKKYLQTSFLRFLLEKQNNEIQELPEEETNLSNKNLSDEFDRIINGDEVQDEIENDEENDEENIDDLIKEYKLLEKIYKSKTYGNIYNTKSKRK
jgi:hypothetical protein